MTRTRCHPAGSWLLLVTPSTPAPGRDPGIRPSTRRTPVAEVEIGIGKSARRAYGFDDIAIVPSRRTRDPDDIDVSWDLDAYHFELPLLASAMDAVVSPRIAVELGRLGGLGVLNLEGLWTRYEDPEPVYEEIAGLSSADARPAGDLPRTDQARAARRAHP